MNKYLLAFFFGLFIESCGHRTSYINAGKGYEYKIAESDKGKKLQYGNFVQFNITEIYFNGKSDSLIGDTHYYMPKTQPFDSLTIPPMYLKILSKAKLGDSIMVKVSTDSILANADPIKKSFMSKGGFLYTNIKIVNVFNNRDEADSANRAELRINGLKIYNKQLSSLEAEIEKKRFQIETDSKIIEAYLIKNNSKYIKGKWGSFIVINKEGIGKKIAYNDVVALDYTGKIFDNGKIFNSTIDPKFNNLGEYEVTMSHVRNVMPGWTDALMQLHNGARATIYIPSALAYGAKGMLPTIKPNENVIFEIEIKNVISEDSALQIVTENRRRREHEVTK